MPERLSTGHANAVCNVGLKTAYANGVIVVYGVGALPADLNDAITATPLCILTESGLPFTGGAATNGLNFGDAVGGVMAKDPSESWRGEVLEAAGTGTTATFYVHYDNAYDATANPAAVRMAGTVSTSPTAEMPLTDTTLVAGAPLVINNSTYTPKRSE